MAVSFDPKARVNTTTPFPSAVLLSTLTVLTRRSYDADGLRPFRVIWVLPPVAETPSADTGKSRRSPVPLIVAGVGGALASVGEELPFDKALVATGARTSVPGIFAKPMAECGNVISLRRMEEAVGLRALIEGHACHVGAPQMAVGHRGRVSDGTRADD